MPDRCHRRKKIKKKKKRKKQPYPHDGGAVTFKIVTWYVFLIRAIKTKKKIKER